MLMSSLSDGYGAVVAAVVCLIVPTLIFELSKARPAKVEPSTSKAKVDSGNDSDSTGKTDASMTSESAASDTNISDSERSVKVRRSVMHAYREDSVVPLTIHPQEEKEVELPHDITNQAAIEAASVEIQELIDKKGFVGAIEAAHIIQDKMKVLQLLWSHFPGAMSSEDVLEGFKRVVEKRGYTDDNTLFAQSICPDEINHEEGDITDLFTKYCGEVFHMGGLAGIPFTGKVGFGAFSHHVPDGGHCAVLMAPHIGIDNLNQFGSYSRDGQDHSGTCCGAAVGAYVHCREGRPAPDLSADPEFYQFNYIINQVKKNYCQVIGETECEKQASLARLMHKVGSDMLKKCVNVDFGSEKSTLVILTGIQINMPRPFDDFFLPLEFYIMKKDGSVEDVFDEAFHHEKWQKEQARKAKKRSLLNDNRAISRRRSFFAPKNKSGI